MKFHAFSMFNNNVLFFGVYVRWLCVYLVFWEIPSLWLSYNFIRNFCEKDITEVFASVLCIFNVILTVGDAKNTSTSIQQYLDERCSFGSIHLLFNFIAKLYRVYVSI